ncbi:hypothetical protein BCV70DRAFT_200007 [Testicularia cyperi]|uniref:Uncharacterized protein n=1 Tax=Testicularia cyperi TaxID=1882483 RepID=A0A317XR09_9BASI|nr:hypothetical protein BCV70DRAFT_200007 [Testicularia cyperi]
MGVSSTARLPTLGAQSIPQLFTHLQVSSNAKVVSRWSITIRSFRAVPVPTNAWPSSSYNEDAGASSSSSLNAGSSSNSAAAPSSSSGPPPLTKPRTMWQVWLSDYPGVVFIIVEDAGQASRAKVWKDWEIRKKKWRTEKRLEIKKRKEREAEAASAASDSKANEEQTIPDANGQAGTSTALQAGAATASSDENGLEKSIGQGAYASTNLMDVDAASAPHQLGQSDRDLAGVATATGTGDGSEEPVPVAGPKPELRMPAHTRYSVAAVTSSMSAMLTSLNLPPPHGAPVGTAGPGAWVPRGAAVSIEGLVLEISSQNMGGLGGVMGAASHIDDNGQSNVDWRVRVGSVVGGGGRSAGAVVEAEFLPISGGLLPTSPYVQNFLQSLFPPNLVTIPTVPPVGPGAFGSIPGMMGMPMNGVGQPNMQSQPQQFPHQQQQHQHGSNGIPGMLQPQRVNGASGMQSAALGTSANLTPANYVIGSSAKLPGNTPNSSFNIPVISDQLWEEVVPRSGDQWRQLILSRCQQLKQARLAKSRKEAVKTILAEDEKNGTSSTSAFGWQTFGESSQSNGATGATDRSKTEDEDDLSSGDELEANEGALGGTDASAAGGAMAGTTVTMQQLDDDDDDDDDRPLGASMFASSNANLKTQPNAQPASAPASALPPRDETVQLTFQGLRCDSTDGAEANGGWSGIERGRRIAFHYVQMLRAEGII